MVLPKQSTYERFCAEISIPVVKYMMSTNSFKIRIFTFLVFLLLLGVSVYQCFTLIAYYFSNPITVVVTETEKDIETFPALVICPAGQFRASQIVDRMSDETFRMDFARDIREIEENRNEFIEILRKENVTYTEGFIKETTEELRKISIAIEVADNESWKQINASLMNISKSLQDIFPSMASGLTLTEPIKGGQLILHGPYEEEPSDIFAKFREVNEMYDSIRFPCRFSSWQESLAFVMKERIEAKDPRTGGAVASLDFIAKYPKMVNFLRPAKEDIIMDCIWAGKQCNISDVWTPQGLCFRVGPENAEDSTVKHTGADANSAVNILIDTLTHESRNKPTKVFFYTQNETEYAQLSGGIIVKPGMVSHMSITQTRENIRSNQNCGEVDLKHFKSYSQEKCNWEKKTERIAKNCSCLSDMTPNYFADSMAEVEKMKNDSKYNTTLKFCSFISTLFCAPNFFEKNVVCPNTCQDIAYEVDMITNPLDELTLAPRLKGKDERFTNILDQISQYGSFRKAPGSDLLDLFLDDFFRQHLNLIKMFWWRNDSTPYYKVWVTDQCTDNTAELSEYYGCDATGTSFGACAFRTTMPCIGSHFNEKLFSVPNKTYSDFINIINATVTKYMKYHFGWRNNYTSEALLPFADEIYLEIDEAEEKHDDSFYRMKSLILQKFMYCFNDMCIFNSNAAPGECRDVVELGTKINIIAPPSKRYLNILSNYDTDSSLADQWSLKCVRELNDVLQKYSNGNCPDNLASKRIVELINTFNGTAPSLWDMPFSIYLKWFENELKGGSGIYYTRSHTLASMTTHNGYMLDVSTVASSYAAETAHRENLRKALVDVSKALIAVRDLLSLISSALEKMNYSSEDKYYVLSYNNYATILYQRFAQNSTIRKMIQCFDDTSSSLNSFLSSNRVFQLSENDATRTIWYKEFTKLIDSQLHVYRNGPDYHKASLAEINVFFRSFRRRTVEEQEAYNMWNMLSDIGGALGLWLGATVLTLYELIILSLSPKIVLARPKDAVVANRKRRRSI